MAANQWSEDDAIARVLRLSDGRVVVPTEYQGNSYICATLRPRAKTFTIVRTADLLAAKEIEV